MKRAKSLAMLSVTDRQVRLESFAKYAGLATVGVEWLSLLIYYLKMPLYFDGSHPVSYFATIPETRFVFSVCYVIASVCGWIFVKHHLAKYYRTPLKIFGVSLLLFAAMGVFPYNSDNTVSHIIHISLALSSGVLFLCGMYMLAKHAKDKFVLSITKIAVILSVGLNCALFLSPPDSQLIFTFEVSAWLMTQLWVIWMSFYTHKRKRLE